MITWDILTEQKHAIAPFSNSLLETISCPKRHTLLTEGVGIITSDCKYIYLLEFFVIQMLIALTIDI